MSTTIGTWKATQRSLNLPDDELSYRVKKRIALFEEKSGQLQTLITNINSGKLSQADKEQFETAKGVLEEELKELNSYLTADITRLHGQRDLNKAKRERLKNHAPKHMGGDGKKQKAAAASAEPKPAATTPAANDPAQTPTKTDAKASATTPAAPAANPKPTPPAKTASKKDENILFAIFGSIGSFLLGALIGKKLK